MFIKGYFKMSYIFVLLALISLKHVFFDYYICAQIIVEKLTKSPLFCSSGWFVSYVKGFFVVMPL